MEASFAPNRKHYPNLILDMKFMTPLTLEKLKVPMQVYIEGNISAGKSELLKHFEEKTNVITIPEPLTRWENFFGTDLLKLKYEDNEKFEFLFQSIANMTRMEQINEHCHKGVVKIMERSLQSSFNVFVKNSKENYHMDDLTFKALKYSHDILCTKGALDALTCPDLYIYLQTSPKICFKRMRERNREAEKNVDLKFLENLHIKHEEWLNQVDSEEKELCPILVLDGNVGREKFKELADKAIETILKIANEKQSLKALFPEGPVPLLPGSVTIVKARR